MATVNNPDETQTDPLEESMTPLRNEEAPDEVVPAHVRLDPDETRAAFDLVRQTIGRYFRSETHGADNLPSGRGLIVGCHSGVIPYDAACTLAGIEDETGRLAYGIGDNFFGRSPAVIDFLNTRGAIVGKPEQVTELLEEDNLVLLFPGGTRDMTRRFWSDQYRVIAHRGFAKGRGGYIKIALRTRSPIVPLAVIGAEEAHVLLHESSPLAKLIGVPFFPVVAFPFPLPVKMYIRFGEPIHFEHGPEAAEDQEVVDELNRMVRWKVQELIDDTRSRRKGIIWSHLE